VNADGSIAPAPISLTPTTSQVYLVLYGTGIYWAGTEGVTVTINGVSTPVNYAGMQGALPGEFYMGLDQVVFQIPPSLAGKGNVNIQLTAAGIPANPVQVVIK